MSLARLLLTVVVVAAATAIVFGMLVALAAIWFVLADAAGTLFAAVIVTVMLGVVALLSGSARATQ
jgi:hypothetical protein